MYVNRILSISFALSVVTVGIAEDAVSQRVSQAQHQLEYANAQVEYHQSIVDSLITLQQTGHASQQEVEQEKATLTAAQAVKLHAAKIIQKWEEKSLTQHVGKSHKKSVVIQLPSLGKDWETIGFEIVMPVNRNLVAKLNRIKSETDQVAVSPADAREELTKRLVNIDPASSSSREIELSQLKLDISRARENAEQHHRSSVWVTPTAGSNELANQREIDVLRSMERIAIQEGLLAQRKAIAAKIQMLTALRTGVLKAEAGALPYEEMQLTLRLQIAELQRRTLDQRLSIIRRDAQELIPVSVSTESATASKLFGRDVTTADLSQAIEAVRSQIQAAIKKKEYTANIESKITNQASQISQLAKEDAYFQREAERVNLRMKVAAASAADARMKLSQLHDTLEFLSGLSDTENSEEYDWQSALGRILSRQAESKSAIALLEAESEFEADRMNALQSLYSEGYATWKEWKAAEVRGSVLKQRLSHVQTEAKRYSLVSQNVQRYIRKTFHKTNDKPVASLNN